MVHRVGCQVFIRDMKRFRAVVLVISLVGTLAFVRACYLVSFSTGYGIKEADRNAIIFRWGAILCGLVFVGTGIGVLMEVIRNRRQP